MARTNKHDYFQMFVDLQNFSIDSAQYLEEVLENFDPSHEVLEVKMNELHAIEHAADEGKHDLMQRLVKEFITPIEREDIIEITQMIDDITDAVEEVLQKVYMFNVKTIRPEAIEFASIIHQLCVKVGVVLQEFHNFKKSHVLHNIIIEVNELEETGDAIYIKAMRRLFDDSSSATPIEALAWKAIFDQLEKCCDRCEELANLVEEVIMKNS